MLLRAIPKRNERSSSTLSFLDSSNQIDSDSDSYDYNPQIIEQANTEPPHITLKDTRINVLSKKTKQLNLAYQNEKTKNSSLSKRIAELESKLLNTQEQSNSIPVKSDDSKQSKISGIIRKLEEERGLSQRLKLEVKALKKIVQRETGKEYEKIQEGSWKGRQEQIHILKDRIREIEQNGSRYDLDSERSERKIDIIKRRDILKVSNELETATQDLRNFKLKYDASAARIKNLEYENKDLRAKLQACLTKNANDDKLILALQNQIVKLKSNTQKESNSVFENLKQLCSEQEEQLQKLQGGATPPNICLSSTPILKDKIDSLLQEKKQHEEIIFELKAKVALIESQTHKSERKNCSSKMEVYQDEIQGLKGNLI